MCIFWPLVLAFRLSQCRPHSHEIHFIYHLHEQKSEVFFLKSIYITVTHLILSELNWSTELNWWRAYETDVFSECKGYSGLRVRISYPILFSVCPCTLFQSVRHYLRSLTVALHRIESRMHSTSNGYVAQTTPICTFFVTFHIFIVSEHRYFNFLIQVDRS